MNHPVEREGERERERERAVVGWILNGGHV